MLRWGTLAFKFVLAVVVCLLDYLLLAVRMYAGSSRSQQTEIILYDMVAANPAGGKLNKENHIFRKIIFSLSPLAPEHYLVFRDGFGRPVPRQPDHSPHAEVNRIIIWCLSLLTGFFSSSSSRFPQLDY